MPNKKKHCPPKCITRQLLETAAIQDLENLAQNLVCPRTSKQFNGPGPSECGPCECKEDNCGPSVCSLDRQCEEMVKSRRRKEVESLPCQLECKGELDAVFNKIASCRDFFRKLTLEAQDILEPRNSQHDSCCTQDPQYERCAQKQNMLKGAVCSSKHTDMEDYRIEPNKPMVQNSNNVGSEKQMYAHTSCSSLQDQCTSKVHTMPPTPPRSLSRNLSVPIAQTACKVKEGRLCKSDAEKLNKADTPEAKNIYMNLLQKVFGKKSDCSCESSRKQEIKQNKDKKADCLCDENANKGIKKADCFCDESATKGNKKADCFCDESATKGNKKVDCFCDENASKGNKKFDCFCDENATKGNKKADCFCDEEMAKQNKENERKKNCRALTSENLARTACPCCFPPAYNQYFNCTGQVSGNCNCDKNV